MLRVKLNLNYYINSRDCPDIAYYSITQTDRADHERYHENIFAAFFYPEYPAG